MLVRVLHQLESMGHSIDQLKLASSSATGAQAGMDCNDPVQIKLASSSATCAGMDCNDPVQIKLASSSAACAGVDCNDPVQIKLASSSATCAGVDCNDLFVHLKIEALSGRPALGVSAESSFDEPWQVEYLGSDVPLPAAPSGPVGVWTSRPFPNRNSSRSV